VNDLPSIYCHFVAQCSACSGWDEDGAPNGDPCDDMFEWVEEQKRKQEARKSKLTAFAE